MVIRIFQKTSKNIITGCVEDDGKEKKEKWCDICPSRSNCSIKQKWNFKYKKRRKTMVNKMEVYSRLIDYCDEKGLDVYTYPGISEKGYEDIPMITANWNRKKLNKIIKWGEKYFEGEVEFEWDDEWSGCSDCNKAIRKIADLYVWIPSFLWLNDDIICHNHYEDYVEEIIDEYKNSTDKAIYRDFFPLLEKAGFICYSPDEYCQKFETGWHTGQDDDPRKVAKDIEENLPGYDYIFKIDSVGQFDISWSVFLRKGDYNEG